MLGVFRRSAAVRDRVRALQEALVGRARAEIFFRDLHVADTIDGRFDLVVLHAFLLLERLGAQGETELAQRLTDALFVGFDEGLRDLGAGDMGMGRRIKTMATAFHGRLKAYGEAEGRSGLADALSRNVYRGGEHSEDAQTLARYVETARMALSICDVAQGAVDFGPLPNPAGTS
jgi:cytochrome b pre-mRNA-processing protein 3